MKVDVVFPNGKRIETQVALGEHTEVSAGDDTVVLRAVAVGRDHVELQLWPQAAQPSRERVRLVRDVTL